MLVVLFLARRILSSRKDMPGLLPWPNRPSPSVQLRISMVETCALALTRVLGNCSVKAAADRRRQEQMAKVKVEKKKKAARGTEVGGFEAHTKGAVRPPPMAIKGCERQLHPH